MVKVNRESSFSYVQAYAMPTGPSAMGFLKGPLLQHCLPKRGIRNDIRPPRTYQVCSRQNDLIVKVNQNNMVEKV